MKRIALLVFVLLAATSVAMAQYKGTIPTPPAPGTLPSGLRLNSFNVALGQDVLGAHNGYGRGCVMCHAPHSGSAGNGAKPVNVDPQNGMYALWGEDLTPLFGQVFDFSGDGAARYPVSLPASGTLTSAHDANTIILFCLSCHDGNLAKVGMMKGQTVEALPVVGGSAPTLLGAQAPSGGAPYNNDHPVGGYAVVGCQSGGTLPSSPPFPGGPNYPSSLNSSHNWDCTGGGTTPITFSANMNTFMTTDYPASFWNGSGGKLASFGSVVTAVTCTTCHDQHSMTVYSNSTGSYPTMFFINGEYMPSTGGNSVAQFCRNCHGGESNEINGLTVPTT